MFACIVSFTASTLAKVAVTFMQYKQSFGDQSMSKVLNMVKREPRSHNYLIHLSQVVIFLAKIGQNFPAAVRESPFFGTLPLLLLRAVVAAVKGLLRRD